MIDPEILKQVRRIQVLTGRLVTDVMAGGYNSVFRGSGIEFDEVREYTEGDDPRSVDWNVTARTGRPYIKKFVEERELTVTFLLDLSSSTRAGFHRRSAREAAAQFCACIALSAIRNNDKVGLITFTDRVERFVPPKKGVGHVLRIVRDCLAHEPKGTGTRLSPALEFAGHVLRRKSILFLVSDFQTSDPYERELSIVSRRHDVIAARVEAPEWSRGAPRTAASHTPAAGLMRLRDFETGREYCLDFSNKKTAHLYQQRVRAFREELDARLRRARVDSLCIPAEGNIVDPILKFFRRRERRAARG